MQKKREIGRFSEKNDSSTAKNVLENTNER